MVRVSEEVERLGYDQFVIFGFAQRLSPPPEYDVRISRRWSSSQYSYHCSLFDCKVVIKYMLLFGGRLVVINSIVRLKSASIHGLVALPRRTIY